MEYTWAVLTHKRLLGLINTTHTHYVTTEADKNASKYNEELLSMLAIILQCSQCRASTLLCEETEGSIRKQVATQSICVHKKTDINRNKN